MKVLVTGGTGFIGSHTLVVLLEAGHKVVAADNLCNSCEEVLNRIFKITGKKVNFYRIDVADEADVDAVFSEHSFDGVIHFAGLKSVEESVEEPLKYYHNNVGGTIVLAEACKRHCVSRFVFSSSATVYGINRIPFTESMELKPTANPYGETKVMSEHILTDAARADGQWSLALLRYFNPVGAHESGLIGENPLGVPNNLMPYITQVASGRLDKLRIFGNDYPTKDGTGIRDYIHVMDLAEGHLAALMRMTPGVHLYNLGTGRGTSVLELVNTFAETTGISIPFEFKGRRKGDIASCYADVTKAQEELGWAAKRDLGTMCKDAWHYEVSLKNDG